MASLGESIKAFDMGNYNRKEAFCSKDASAVSLSELIEWNPVFYQVRNKRSDFHASDVPLKNASRLR